MWSSQYLAVLETIVSCTHTYPKLYHRFEIRIPQKHVRQIDQNLGRGNALEVKRTQNMIHSDLISSMRVRLIDSRCWYAKLFTGTIMCKSDLCTMPHFTGRFIDAWQTLLLYCVIPHLHCGVANVAATNGMSWPCPWNSRPVSHFASVYFATANLTSCFSAAYWRMVCTVWSTRNVHLHGSSFTWHQSCNKQSRCKCSAWMYNLKTHYKRVSRCVG